MTGYCYSETAALLAGMVGTGEMNCYEVLLQCVIGKEAWVKKYVKTFLVSE